jgi:hypothetical protein
MSDTTDVTYRVIRLPQSLLTAIRNARDQAEVTNAQFISDAVENHLPKFVTELCRLGFGDREGVMSTSRLPFADESAVLGQLREASESVGLPVTRLLELCLVATIQQTEVPKRRRGRRTKSGESAGTKSKRPRRQRK